MTKGRLAGRHPLRVAYFHQSADMYGSDRVLLDVVLGTAERGVEPVVVLQVDGPLGDELRRAGIETHIQPILKISRATLTPRGIVDLARSVCPTLLALDRLLDGRRFDVVHSNTLAVIGGALWARRHRIPHLWHVHEIIDRPAAAATVFPWLVARLSDRVVCNSKATQRWLLRRQPKLASRTQMIWNAVHDPRTLPSGGTAAGNPLAGKIVFDEASAVVGLVGRINRWKGHTLLIEAAELLSTRGTKNFLIVFVGSPAPGNEYFLDDLNQRIATSPIRDRISLIGFTPRVNDVYPLFDICCVPSTEPEPFGLVAVEAMSHSKPVVAANIGGLPELVDHGETGLLFEARDAGDLAAKLQALLDSPDLRHRLGASGRRKFEREFAQESFARRFAEVFEGMALSNEFVVGLPA